MNENSYINNSSVSKSAVHKRRNVPIVNGNQINQYDRSSVDTANNLNGITRPSINNTYNGSNLPKTSQNMSKLNSNAIRSRKEEK